MHAANLAILDTSVYIDNLRTGRFKQKMLELPFAVRCSAVVLAELSRGVRSREMKKFVNDLEKNLRVIHQANGNGQSQDASSIGLSWRRF